MARLAKPAVEVVAPDGTKSLWVAALAHRDALAAVRKIIPPDHIAELSILRLRRSPKLEGLRPGEVRKVEPSPAPKNPSDTTVDIAADQRDGFPPMLSQYREYAVGSDGQFIGFRQMICCDDNEAVAKAKRPTKDYDIEIWNGDRFVIRLIHRSK
jgi:hypothetical protein